MKRIILCMVSVMILVTCLSACSFVMYERKGELVIKNDTDESGTVTQMYEKTYMTTEGFLSISEAADSYKFKTTMWAVEPYESSFSRISIGGEYALSGEQNDTIVIDFDLKSGEGSIVVNDARMNFYGCSVEDAAIIDIDESDPYKEIAVFDAGPSDDPTIIIYRYVDNVIHEVGAFYGRYSYDTVLFDKKGKIIDASRYIDFTEEQIVTGYYELRGNATKDVAVDYSGALNKTYKLSRDLPVLFAETDNMELEEALGIFQIENYMELKQSEEIEIIKADTSFCIYYVKLPDGRKGVITTQIAG